jgi:TolB-like protein
MAESDIDLSIPGFTSLEHPAMSAAMQKCSLLAFLFCLAAQISPAFAESPRHTAAVTDLAAQGVDASAVQVISDRLRSECVKTGVFTMVERGQMESILKEQGFQQSGACRNDACLVEMGQLLGVEYLIAGNVGKVGRTYTLGLRLVDIKSGKISATANVDCKCEVDELLSTSSKEVVTALVNDLNKNEGSSQTVSPPSQSAASASANPASKPAGSPVHSKARIGLKVGLAAGGLVALGAGIFMDQDAKKYLDKAATIKQTYIASGNNTGYTTYAADYQSSLTSAQQSMIYRNVGYVLSGLCAAGLVLTFAF